MWRICNYLTVTRSRSLSIETYTAALISRVLSDSVCTIIDRLADRGGITQYKACQINYANIGFKILLLLNEPFGNCERTTRIFWPAAASAVA